MISVRWRIILLLSVLMAAFWGGIGLQSRLEEQKIARFATLQHTEKRELIQRLLTLKSVTLEATASDYSVWDDLVNYLHIPHRKWAASNLDTALTSVHLQAIWCYDLSLRQRYKGFDPAYSHLPQNVLTPDRARRLFANQTSARFFLPYRDTVIEIRGSTVHASKDTQRKGKRFGYFLVGKVWDVGLLKELSDLAQCRLLIKSLRDGQIWKERSSNDAEFEMSVPFADAQNRTHSELIAQSDLPAIVVLRESSRTLQKQFLLFAVSVLLFLAGCLLNWINVPLKLLTVALKRQSTQPLEHIVSQRTEFGEMARLIADSFTQKAERATLLQQIQATNAEVTDAYDATIEGWSRALDLRDEETEGHSRRVTEWSVRLAGQMGIGGETLVYLRRGALLHDVGKLGIPDAILLKPGKLTPEEWCIMRMHPTYAYEWLSAIAYLKPSLDIPYCHHEKWDGSGYPQGLKGEEIPFAARIFAIVDVWDALTSDRPYREAMAAQEACDYIVSCSGTHFDPQVVEAFLTLITTESLPAPSFPLRRAA